MTTSPVPRTDRDQPEQVGLTLADATALSCPRRERDPASIIVRSPTRALRACCRSTSESPCQIAAESEKFIRCVLRQASQHESQRVVRLTHRHARFEIADVVRMLAEQKPGAANVRSSTTSNSCPHARDRSAPPRIEGACAERNSTHCAPVRSHSAPPTPRPEALAPSKGPHGQRDLVGITHRRDRISIRDTQFEMSEPSRRPP